MRQSQLWNKCAVEGQEEEVEEKGESESKRCAHEYDRG